MCADDLNFYKIKRRSTMMTINSRILRLIQEFDDEFKSLTKTENICSSFFFTEITYFFPLSFGRKQIVIFLYFLLSIIGLLD